MKTRITLFFFACIIAVSCTKDVGYIPPVPLDCSTITYSNYIAPLVNTECTSCHQGNFVYGNFTTYAGLKAKVDNGSFKFRVIDAKLMPTSGPLPPLDLQKIQCWLDAGAPNN